VTPTRSVPLPPPGLGCPCRRRPDPLCHARSRRRACSGFHAKSKSRCGRLWAGRRAPDAPDLPRGYSTSWTPSAPQNFCRTPSTLLRAFRAPDSQSLRPAGQSPPNPARHLPWQRTACHRSACLTASRIECLTASRPRAGGRSVRSRLGIAAARRPCLLPGGPPRANPPTTSPRPAREPAGVCLLARADGARGQEGSFEVHALALCCSETLSAGQAAALLNMRDLVQALAAELPPTAPGEAGRAEAPVRVVAVPAALALVRFALRFAQQELVLDAEKAVLAQSVCEAVGGCVGDWVRSDHLIQLFMISYARATRHHLAGAPPPGWHLAAWGASASPLTAAAPGPRKPTCIGRCGALLPGRARRGFARSALRRHQGTPARCCGVLCRLARLCRPSLPNHPGAPPLLTNLAPAADVSRQSCCAAAQGVPARRAVTGARARAARAGAGGAAAALPHEGRGGGRGGRGGLGGRGASLVSRPPRAARPRRRRRPPWVLPRPRRPAPATRCLGDSLGPAEPLWQVGARLGGGASPCAAGERGRERGGRCQWRDASLPHGYHAPASRQCLRFQARHQGRTILWPLHMQLLSTIWI
jgi:hypothetical protein